MTTTILLAGAVLALAAGSIADEGTGTRGQTEPTVPVRELVSAANLRDKGLVCLLNGDPALVRDVAAGVGFSLSALDSDAARLKTCRDMLYSAGLLNGRVMADQWRPPRLPYAGFLCDSIVAPALSDEALAQLPHAEILRALKPRGVALIGSSSRNVAGLKEWGAKLAGARWEIRETALGSLLRIEAPDLPGDPGSRDWSHWRGSPGNSMSSTDTAGPPFLLQWAADPALARGPNVALAAAGRLFFVSGDRDWGGIPPDSEPRTVHAYNGYNGILLWKKRLDEKEPTFWPGFAATADTFFLAGRKNCLLLDPATGAEKRALSAPRDKVGESTEWKWIAVDGNSLCALLGPPKSAVEVKSGWTKDSAAWWAPNTAYEGMGDTLAVFNLRETSGAPAWVLKIETFVNGRILAASGGRVFYQASTQHVGCVEIATGKVLWKVDDPETMKLLGRGDVRYFSVDAFATANDLTYLSYWNRKELVCFDAKDGKVLWHRSGVPGRHIFARTDHFLIGNEKVDALTGKGEGKRFGIPGPSACALDTSSARTVFISRSFCCHDLEKKRSWQLGTVRSACTVGMIPANGMVYGTASFCQCGFTLNGMTAFAPAGAFVFEQKAVEAERLQSAPDAATVKPLEAGPDDWATYRHDNSRSGASPVKAPSASVEKKWAFPSCRGELPSTPSAVGELVFVGGSSGAVRALDAASGKERWVFFTGGAVRFPPSIRGGRAFVGSCDGRICALEALTGRLLWSFRAAPEERMICLRERLCSTWPVAGGVVAEEGSVYAGAGLLDSSGNHVYCLDETTGSIKWQQNVVRQQGGNRGWGMTMLGPMALGHGRLYTSALNRMIDLDAKSGAIGKGEGDLLRAGKGAALGGPGLGGAINYSTMDAEVVPADIRNKPTFLVLPAAHKDLSVVAGRKAKGALAVECFQSGGPTNGLWTAPLASYTSCESLIIAGDVVLAAASSRKPGGPVPVSAAEPAVKAEVFAFSAADGKELWRIPLDAPAVPHGLAVDRRGQLLVSQENGFVLCFQGKSQ